MNTKKLAVIGFAIALAVAVQMPIVTAVHAEDAAVTATASASTDVSSFIEKLKALIAKVADLRSQISTAKTDIASVQSDIKDSITSTYKEGMTNDQIKQIQDLLSSDKTIYPEGLTTGYFGQLTKNALMRFQDKHGLAKTGEVDQDTKDVLNEYMRARFGTTTPNGVLRAPGIFKKVHESLCGRDDHQGSAWGLFCKDFTSTSTSNMGHHSTSTEDHGSNPHGWTVCTGGVATGCHPQEHFATSTYQTARMDKAQQAIDDAQSKIDSVQSDIDDATSSAPATAAELKLDQAKTQLTAAQTAFDAELYGSAAIDANKAKATAVIAGKLL